MSPMRLISVVLVCHRKEQGDDFRKIEMSASSEESERREYMREETPRMAQ